MEKFIAGALKKVSTQIEMLLTAYANRVTGLRQKQWSLVTRSKKGELLGWLHRNRRTRMRGWSRDMAEPWGTKMVVTSGQNKFAGSLSRTVQ